MISTDASAEISPIDPHLEYLDCIELFPRVTEWEMIHGPLQT